MHAALQLVMGPLQRTTASDCDRFPLGAVEGPPELELFPADTKCVRTMIAGWVPSYHMTKIINRSTCFPFGCVSRDIEVITSQIWCRCVYLKEGKAAH